jgi:hypothetical protein
MTEATNWRDVKAKARAADPTWEIFVLHPQCGHLRDDLIRLVLRRVRSGDALPYAVFGLLERLRDLLACGQLTSPGMTSPVAAYAG